MAHYGGCDDDYDTVWSTRPSLVGDIRQEITLAGTGRHILPSEAQHEEEYTVLAEQKGMCQWYRLW